MSKLGPFPRALPVISALLMALILGCAGGSTLTGIRFQGVVVQGNSVVRGLAVTVAETGETDVTDENGHFDIWSTTFSESAELKFSNDSTADSLFISGIPDTAEFVELTLALEGGKITLLQIVTNPGEIPLETTTTTSTTTTLNGDTPSDELFDRNGDTRAFDIPSGLTGNVGRGRAVWRRICQSCHVSEKRGATYSDVRSALRSEPQMRLLSISAQQTADVVAYLNRGAR